MTRYLADYGWKVSVLTATPGAYTRVNEENFSLIPSSTEVCRAIALDSQRHLAIKGRHLASLSIPDRWRTWQFFARRLGSRLIRESRPDVILSSFPIPSAVVVARDLHKEFGIPWVADLRDPILTSGHPPPGKLRDVYESIEEDVVNLSARIIVTTPGARRDYLDRYDALQDSEVRVVENGYEEALFEDAGRAGSTVTTRSGIELLHSGLVYQDARNPLPLFLAVRALLDNREIREDELRIVFRASSRENFINSEAERLGLADVVATKPPISYREAIAEMMAADSLLLIQSADCNNQIPAKAYEYLRSRKPILALTDPVGDTGRLLHEFGVQDIAELENPDMVVDALRKHVARLRAGQFEVQPAETIEALSRESRANEFNRVLTEVADEAT